MRSFRFGKSVRDALARLRAQLGFELWMVTRVEREEWIVLGADDASYGVTSGSVLNWGDSLCSRMLRGEGPGEAPDSARVPAYASAPISKQMPIGAYVGVPLYRDDGGLFGTLCAIQSAAREPLSAAEYTLLDSVAMLLGALLHGELERHSLERRIEQLETAATRDALTGLLNRRGWQQAVFAEEARCRELMHPAAVLVIDLDDLKFVNDEHGHEAGDALLRKTAEVLVTASGANAVVARLGGDEFAVLLIETDAAAAHVTLERIERALVAAVVSASIGLGQRQTTSDLFTAYREADHAMYACKRLRRSHKPQIKPRTSVRPDLSPVT